MGNDGLSSKQIGSQATRRLAWIQPVCIIINAVPALKVVVDRQLSAYDHSCSEGNTTVHVSYLCHFDLSRRSYKPIEYNFREILRYFISNAKYFVQILYTLLTSFDQIWNQMSEYL